MDRAYFQLVDETTDIVRYANAIARNSAYKDEIAKATSNLVIDAIREAQRVKLMLQQVIIRQELAANMSDSL